MKKMPTLNLTKIMVSEAAPLSIRPRRWRRRSSRTSTCHTARRGVDRAAAAGSARRAGQDRAEGDRRRSVPAMTSTRRRCGSARCRGRGLRELGWRRREHRLLAAACAHLRSEQDAGRQHRRLPQRRTGQSEPRRAEEGAAPRPEGVRAVGGLPAHQGAKNPLDGSAVHPEAYELVEQIAEATKRRLPDDDRRTVRSSRA